MKAKSLETVFFFSPFHFASIVDPAHVYAHKRSWTSTVSAFGVSIRSPDSAASGTFNVSFNVGVADATGTRNVTATFSEASSGSEPISHVLLVLTSCASFFDLLTRSLLYSS